MMSKAVGIPSDQLLTKASAGRDLERSGVSVLPASTFTLKVRLVAKVYKYIDVRFVKDLFSYLGEKDVVVVDCFRLGKPLVTSSASKPRLLKVSLANSNQRTSILKKQRF